MKIRKTAKLADSMADIAARSPFAELGPESRYVVVSELRMGDGGKKDESALAKKALFAILGRWYLPRGYTLVLNGDIEDLRRFWLKDILAAWPELYAVFDAYAEKGRLKKIVGERDLALLLLGSYPYELSHGFRLDGLRSSILVLHGHQAAPPYAGRDYLSDYMQHWLGSFKRTKKDDADDGAERLKIERRLCRAAARIGMAVVQGHTRRPLFESVTNRDAVRADVERLIGAEEAQVERSPFLFCPGRALGSNGLRFLEIDGDRLSLVRWTRNESRKSDGNPYSRLETRSTSLGSLFERIERIVSETGRGEATP